MQFTFGIVTEPENAANLHKVIKSIEDNHIPEYEIIVVGGELISHNNLTYLSFNENDRWRWITKKKNLVTQHAKYPNIVFLHDYISLDPDWYQGYLKYGDNFNVCINPLRNPDGTRYRDLTFFPSFLGRELTKLNAAKDITESDIVIDSHECLIPYENFKESAALSKWMYYSGAYWVAKRDVMREFPLNEALSWGQGEDVTWSDQISNKYNFGFNPHSICRLLKKKDPIFKDLTESTIKNLQRKGLLA